MRALGTGSEEGKEKRNWEEGRRRQDGHHQHMMYVFMEISKWLINLYNSYCVNNYNKS
jgi:hypothetical protein